MVISVSTGIRFWKLRVWTRWLQPIAPGTIDIVAGAVTRTLDVRDVTDRVVLEGLHIPEGDLEFKAIHRQAREAPYQVALIRR